MIRKPLLLIVCWLLLAYGCATPGGRDAPISEDERRAYSAARAVLRDDPAEATRQLESFMRQWPRSGLADDASELLAELAAARGDSQAELGWLRTLLRDHPQGDRSDSARLRVAQIELGAGKAAAAQRVLQPIRYSRLTPAEELAAYELQAQLSEGADRVLWLARARGLQREPQAQLLIDGQIDAQLQALGRPELERLASALGNDTPAARVQLQLATLALAAGDFDEAASLLARVERMSLSESEAQLLAGVRRRLELREGSNQAVALPTFDEALKRDVPPIEGATGAIGVVLPLSGPFQRFGEESLRGILLATQIFDRAGEGLPDVASNFPNDPSSSGEGNPARPRAVMLPAPAKRLNVLRVVVRDSGGEPERAAAAVRELADEGVVAIVGPLLSGPAEAAARTAEELRVPLLTLTSRQEVPRDRPYVFRVRTTPDDEIRFLVDYAINELQAERFAILHPADGYGRGMRDRFWERVEANGAGVVGVASYDPTSTDFADSIRRMIGFEMLTSGERAALKEREFVLRRARRLDPEVGRVVREVAYSIRGPEGEPLPPRVDFDVVFIPDSYDKIGLIAPQLAFHEVTDVRLLGPDGWNHPDLVEVAREHVRGAVIAAAFHKDSRFAPVARFVEAYQATYELEPESLSAQAYDATNLVQTQLARGRRSREAVREGVLQTEAYPGASGVLTLLPDGNSRKRPFMLGVRRGRIVSLD